KVVRKVTLPDGAETEEPWLARIFCEIPTKLGSAAIAGFLPWSREDRLVHHPPEIGPGALLCRVTGQAPEWLGRRLIRVGRLSSILRGDRGFESPSSSEESGEPRSTLVRRPCLPCASSPTACCRCLRPARTTDPVRPNLL